MIKHKSWNTHATDLQKKWMEELLSGKHKQCLFKFRKVSMIPFVKPSYCAIGLANEIVRREIGVSFLWTEELNLFDSLGSPRIGFYSNNSIIFLNDFDKKSFKEIAEMIMKTPWVWFSNFPVPEKTKETI